MKAFTFIANWKMNVSLKQAEYFYQEHWQQLASIAYDTGSTLVICPSFVVLGNYSTLLSASHSRTIFLGAQDCSPHTQGAYTGDIDALTLYQAGCTFCLVGHSERRHIHQETDELIAQEVTQLQLQKIIPIVCIGESAQEREQNNTVAILKKQLRPILTLTAATENPLYIAYEPVWAIGSGRIPYIENLSIIFQSLQEYIQTYTHKKIYFLYGGGVTPENIKTLKTISLLSGVLIGAASSDFNSFKKIIYGTTDL